MLGVGLVGTMRRYSRRPYLLRVAQKPAKLQVSGGVERSETGPKVVRRIGLRLSAELRAEIVQQYRGGIPTASLCELHGLGKSTVLKLLAEAGVQMRRQPLSEPEIEAAARLFADGRSLSRVSAELGIAQSSLQLAFKQRGVEVRLPKDGTRRSDAGRKCRVGMVTPLLAGCTFAASRREYLPWPSREVLSRSSCCRILSVRLTAQHA
jgi:hypothetical protein